MAISSDKVWSLKTNFSSYISLHSVTLIWSVDIGSETDDGLPPDLHMFLKSELLSILIGVGADAAYNSSDRPW